MKLKLIAITLAVCTVLSGCGAEATPAPEPSVSATPEATATPTPAATPTPEPTPVETPLWEAEKMLDYSDHNHTGDDVLRYETYLADLSKLSGGEPLIAFRPAMTDFGTEKLDELVLNGQGEYDIRSYDVSGLDLSVVPDYNYIGFSSDTVWPDKLPEGFDPDYFLEYNKNPGLGIRALHDEGITGEGVSIAILDQPLSLDHEEYKDKLMLYEQIHDGTDTAQMHGPAVASIAVGETTGVAPGAKLYFIAEGHGHYTGSGYDFDASIIGDSIMRVLEINRHLDEKDKIRVISISRGYNPDNEGYDELMDAIAEADRQGVFVASVGSDEFYDFDIDTTHKDYGADPDDFSSYRPDISDEGFYNGVHYRQYSQTNKFIKFPVSRTYAACTGTDEYEISGPAGISWAVPWCAGLYALCCQVKPDITPQEFVSLLDETGVSTEIVRDGITYDYEKIVNPAGIIERLKQE